MQTEQILSEANSDSVSRNLHFKVSFPSTLDSEPDRFACLTHSILPCQLAKLSGPQLKCPTECLLLQVGHLSSFDARKMSQVTKSLTPYLAEV